MKTIVLIFCLFLMGCTSENNDSEVFIGKITGIGSLTNITLGESDTITVTFSGGNDGCAKPDHLEAAFAGTTISFKAYYNYPVHPTICTENIPIHQLKYTFKPTSRGNYTYRSFDTDASAETKVN